MRQRDVGFDVATSHCPIVPLSHSQNPVAGILFSTRTLFALVLFFVAARFFALVLYAFDELMLLDDA